MTELPEIVSMDPIGTGALGLFHRGVIFGNVKAEGRVRYEFLFAVFHGNAPDGDVDDDAEPLLIVSSEINTTKAGPDAPSHYLGTFDKTGHANLGPLENGDDVIAFRTRAFEVVEKKLGLRPGGTVGQG